MKRTAKSKQSSSDSLYIFLSQRGPWLQPVQMTHCICGICVRGGPPSCTPSNSTERGRHYFIYLKYMHTHSVYSKEICKLEWNIKCRQWEPSFSELESLFAGSFHLGLKKWAAELSECNLSNTRNEIKWHANCHAKAFTLFSEALFRWWLVSVCISYKMCVLSSV